MLNGVSFGLSSRGSEFGYLARDLGEMNVSDREPRLEVGKCLGLELTFELFCRSLVVFASFVWVILFVKLESDIQTHT